MKCPVCGETDPMPAWFCTLRLAGQAVIAKPCPYSVEGHERFAKRMAEKSTQVSSADPKDGP